MKLKLTILRKAVIYKLPVYQIFTVIYRHARKELERGRYKIKIIAYTADAGVRMKARNDRIFVFHCIAILDKILYLC